MYMVPGVLIVGRDRELAVRIHRVFGRDRYHKKAARFCHAVEVGQAVGGENPRRTTQIEMLTLYNSITQR